MRRFLPILTLLACSARASPDPAATPTAPTAIPPPPDDTPDPLIEKRPYDVHVPKGYAEGTPIPLVLGFHGYGTDDDGPTLERYFKFMGVSDAQTFLYITPNGIEDKGLQRFWNGTDACCDFDHLHPDDVAYVRAIVRDVGKHYTLDPKRIYAFGLSGGGFFVHRLACDASDVFAAVISMSGATWNDASQCKPTEPVAVAEIHGTKDDTVAYEGGRLQAFGSDVAYPSAHDTVAHWAAYDACSGALADTGVTYDLFPGVSGAETSVARYDCARGAVELWTVKDGPHAPAIGASFATTAWQFFAAHPKP